uniref:Sulfatase N-terminal domain-containing protein n=1 Tax=Graphocephala atropunctata TaxID=36148 RepID=A0A1B6MUH9_9HEMI
MFYCSYLIFLLLHSSSAIGKHNILLIISDDLRPALGSYGDKNAYTPSIDDLSQESFLFLNANAQQALCAPSRNSLLTSRRPDTLRLYDFYSYWRDVAGNFTTLPQYFREHGYYTKSVGKVFHPGISSNWSDDQPYSWSGTPYHPPSQAFMNAAVCRREGEEGFHSNLVCPVIVDQQPGGTLPDLESLQEARRFLRNWRAGEEGGERFFLAVGFHKPHVPLKYPRKYLDHHPLVNVSLPSNNWPVLLPSVAWNPWTDVRQRDDIASLNISFPFGRIPDEWSRLIRQSYYAAVSYMDDLVGKLLHELRTADLYDNTIVVLLGDHGWSLGEHGEWSKFSNYELAVRVPLVLRVPGLTDRAAALRSTQAPVELLDLFPTLVDAAGLPPLPHCPRPSRSVATCTEGASLLPVIFSTLVKNKKIEDTGKPALSQYPRPGVYPTSHPNSDKPRLHEVRYMGYSLRTAHHRYTEWLAWQGAPLWTRLAGVELYDHAIDPSENINLADREAFQGLRRALNAQLRAAVGQ